MNDFDRALRIYRDNPAVANLTQLLASLPSLDDEPMPYDSATQQVDDSFRQRLAEQDPADSAELTLALPGGHAAFIKEAMFLEREGGQARPLDQAWLDEMHGRINDAVAKQRAARIELEQAGNQLLVKAGESELEHVVNLANQYRMLREMAPALRLMMARAERHLVLLYAAAMSSEREFRRNGGELPKLRTIDGDNDE